MATTTKKTSKKKSVNKKTVTAKTAKKKATAKTAAQKKSATKKAAARKTAAKKPTTKKAARKKQTGKGKIKVTNEQRHKMICEAAYYISLDKTYETINPTEDWLQAENAIDQICIIHEN